MKKRLQGIVLAAILLAGLMLAYQQTQPPRAPKGLDEKPINLEQAQDGMDFRMMLSHIRGMAGEVHSVGSPGLARTQAYLKRQIEGMGYTYTEEAYALSFEEVQALTRVRAAFRGTVDNATIEEIRQRAGLPDAPALPLNNIWVHVDAPDTDETIIFMAHTDSVKEGPGAFDDIVAVAALLEGLRSIQGQTPARDLLFLFTDGEEQGLLGSAKFVEDHPEYQARTRLVVNLEARGNAGALILFETAGYNLGQIRMFRDAVSHPFSVSVATAVYKTMQNDTDLSSFIKAGYPGINLAVIEGSEVYHTELDNYETFSRDSAWHYLDTTVGLVRHLALSQNLHLEAEQDAVHFPLLPGRLAVLPQSAANLLAFAALFLALLMCIWLLKTERIKAGTVLKAMGWHALWVAAGGGLSWGLLQGMYALNQNTGAFHDVLYGKLGDIVVLGLLAACGLAFALMARRACRRTKNPLSWTSGLLLLPALLGVVCAFLFPDAGYTFSLPVLAGLFVILLHLAFKPFNPIYAGLSGVLTLLLYVPLLHLFVASLGIHILFVSLSVFIMMAVQLTGPIFLLQQDA